MSILKIAAQSVVVATSAKAAETYYCERKSDYKHSAASGALCLEKSLHPRSSGSVVKATFRDVLFVVAAVGAAAFFNIHVTFHEFSWASTVIRIRLASQFLVHG